MTELDVLQMVRLHAYEALDSATVPDDLPLSEAGVDSLAAVGISMSLETALNIDINVSLIDSNTSITSLYSLCCGQLRAANRL